MLVSFSLALFRTTNSASLKLKEFGDRARLFQGRFSDVQKILTKQGLRETRFDGVLMDLGVSSPQLDSPDRGFSFKYSFNERMGEQQKIFKIYLIFNFLIF